MFSLCHLPAPEMFFRYSGILGQRCRLFLKCLLNVLDDADVTHFFKDKGKLNRIIKNHSITHVTFLFFFEM